MLKRAKHLARRLLSSGWSGTPLTVAAEAVAVVDLPKPNPYISDDLPPHVAELSARYRERRVTHFLVSQKNIDRQNATIARSARSFFDETDGLRGVSLEQ